MSILIRETVACYMMQRAPVVRQEQKLSFPRETPPRSSITSNVTFSSSWCIDGTGTRSPKEGKKRQKLSKEKDYAWSKVENHHAVCNCIYIRVHDIWLDIFAGTKRHSPHRAAGVTGKNGEVRLMHFFIFFFEGLGCCLNPKESPNWEAIRLVMFIYFVDLVESRIFFWVWSTFSASAVRGESRRTGGWAVHLHCLETVCASWCFCQLFFLVWILAEVCLLWRYEVDSFSLGWNFTRGRSPRRTGQLFTCTVWRPCVLLGAFAFFLVWILAEVCLLDGTRSILSLWDEILPAEEVKRVQLSTTVAAIIVQHVQHLTRRSPNITAKGGEICGTKPSGIRLNFCWGTGKGLERKISVWCAIDPWPWVGMHT